MHVLLTATKGARPVTIALRLPTVIGRSDNAKVRVRQAWVSRNHCALYCEGEQLHVLDLGSSNGTFVNETRIETAHRIQSGDVLRVGKVTFRIDVAPVSTDPTPSATRESDAVAEPSSVSCESEADADSAVLCYRESQDGSFVAIETGQQAEVLVEDFPEIEGARRVTPVNEDSALGRFLKGLDA